MKLAFDPEHEALREEFRKPLADVTLSATLDWLRTGQPSTAGFGRDLPISVGWVPRSLPSSAVAGSTR